MRFELELARGLDSAAEARHALDGLDGRLPVEQLGDVRLLVSELVTNAVTHGAPGESGAVGLTVDVDGGAVRVEVRDPGHGFDPGPAPTDPTRSSGWGLYLVETLSDRWGIEAAEPDGTRVWFELDAAV